MTYNTKNYTEQGGEKTVIGGTLEIKEGATVTGLPSPTLPDPVEIPILDFQSDSEATDVEGLVEDFNALLSKLKAAGLMAEEAEGETGE
ncbi:MAG: Head fiber protein [Enterococcus cecorum]|nr:Head fiber protein [Enterococcus cecorum]